MPLNLINQYVTAHTSNVIPQLFFEKELILLVMLMEVVMIYDVDQFNE